jgi:hypothetical protein
MAASGGFRASAHQARGLDRAGHEHLARGPERMVVSSDLCPIQCCTVRTSKPRRSMLVAYVDRKVFRSNCTRRPPGFELNDHKLAATPDSSASRDYDAHRIED